MSDFLSGMPAAAASVWGTMLNVSAQKEINKANIRNQNELNRRHQVIDLDHYAPFRQQISHVTGQQG